MKHALILGANSGIAKALAHQYASVGYNLTLAARKVERLETLVTDLQIRYNTEVETVEFDALKYSSHDAFYEQLSHKPDVAMCVFGYLGEQPLAERDFAETEMIIHSNYTGALSILNIIANDFEQRRSGTIIGISSVAGDRGKKRNYIYCSAKAGFTTYLSGLRNRLYSANVHVLTVKPGFTDTKMVEHLDLPPALTAQPKEVAMDVYKAHQAGRHVIYSKWFWQVLMLIIMLIPEPIFKKMDM